MKELALGKWKPLHTPAPSPFPIPTPASKLPLRSTSASSFGATSVIMVVVVVETARILPYHSKSDVFLGSYWAHIPGTDKWHGSCHAISAIIMIAGMVAAAVVQVAVAVEDPRGEKEAGIEMESHILASSRVFKASFMAQLQAGGERKLSPFDLWKLNEDSAFPLP